MTPQNNTPVPAGEQAGGESQFARSNANLPRPARRGYPGNMQQGFGASQNDWDHFDLVLGLTEDLLPVVSDPHAEISEFSKMQYMGKTPSRFNRSGKVHGFLDWTDHQTTEKEIVSWAKDDRLGICIQTRLVRAIDVDVGDFDESTDIEAFIEERLGRSLPCRRRSNSTKFLLAFTLPGDYTKRKFETKTEKNAIEFLAGGQQFIACGTHPTGARYEWVGGLPNSIPELTPEEFEALWSALHERFGSGDSVTVRKGVTPAKKRRLEDANDPVLPYLAENWEVFDITDDGRVDIRCPFADGHTDGISEGSSTSFFPAGVGNFAVGHFCCLHASCAGRTDSDFLTAIGYLAQGFDVLDVDDEEYNRKAPGAVRAARMATAAIERAKFSGGRSALEDARREHQKQLNQRIGEGEHTIPPAEVISLETAINRFVFLSDGSRVADIFNPHYDLALSDFSATYAASKEVIPQPAKTLANGRTVPVPDKEISVAKLWAESPRRKTAVCRTFKAGGNLVLNDPEGRPALNSWRPYDRTLQVDDLEAAGVQLFTEHIDYLFGADACRFLDWLAHIEQDPGTLSHTAWLHIAKRFGMGRNWLASVLARVWAGSVAANLDLVGVMRTGFNGALSRKVLAVVDEIREGGRDSQWEHSETLKRTINEEHRRINPKYGRQSVEFNACRFLMFSNHLSAIPMEDSDRRIEVVVSEEQPRGADYYKALYAALNRPAFIAGVAALLAARDISAFNPGAHAMQTEGKKAATKASQSPTAAYCETLVKYWPSDLITAGDLFFILTGRESSSDDSLNAGHRHTLEQYGIQSMGKARKMDGNVVYLSTVRNRHMWVEADTDSIKAELHKAKVGMLNARDYLNIIAAGIAPDD